MDFFQYKDFACVKIEDQKLNNALQNFWTDLTIGHGIKQTKENFQLAELHADNKKKSITDRNLNEQHEVNEENCASWWRSQDIITIKMTL